MLQKKTYFLFQFAILLILPFALFWNLGITAVHADESTRGLVSLEMIFSGNYIVPTINGEYYYNKPPLYNWILAVFIRLFGFSEFVLRLPTIISLIGFSTTVYFFIKKNLNEGIAFLTALGLITSVRILFYDSFHGLIDLSFSWITFLNFICLYQFSKQKKWWLLFTTTYLLTTVGFMMKGLPSLVFQALSLLAYFVSEKDFRKLFHPAHFIGISIFFLLFGCYYFTYYQYNPDVKSYFGTLINESSKRTVFMGKDNYGHFLPNRFSDFFVYFFKFPFSILGVLLPWGILSLFFLRKDFFKIIKANGFLSFCGLIFLVNIPVYWLSPATQPRYLFMLFPFLLLFLFYFHDISRFKNRLTIFLKFSFYVVPLFCFAPLLISKLDFIPRSELILTCCVFSCLSIFLLFTMHKTDYQYLLFSVIIFFLCSRIFFNLTALPERAYSNYESVITKPHAKRLAEFSKGKRVFRIGENTLPSDYYLNHDISMYTSWHMQDIIRMKPKPTSSDEFYIVNSEQLKKWDFEVLYTFETRYHKEYTNGENTRFLVRLK